MRTLRELLIEAIIYEHEDSNQYYLGFLHAKSNEELLSKYQRVMFSQGYSSGWEDSKLHEFQWQAKTKIVKKVYLPEEFRKVNG